MYLKKSVCILLGSILVLTVSSSACSGGTPTSRTLTVSPPTIGATRWVNDFSELPKGTASHVDVVYFHRSVRCEACLNAENYTRETLAKYFAPQIQSGLISLQVLDMELPQNSDLVIKFDAAGSSLYLSILIQGTEYLCPNQDIWFYTSNKYLFVDTLRKKLASLVESS